MTRTRNLLAVLLVTIVAVACTGHGRAVDAEALVPREPGNLVGTAWQLIGTGLSHATPSHGLLRFVEGVVTSTGSCHAQRLAFTDVGDAVRHGPASTTVLCTSAPPAVKVRYTLALGVVDTATLESGSLVLTGPHSVRMVFNPRNHAAHDVIDEL